MKLLLILLLCGILVYWINYEPPRDYTNLTVYEEPYPDIAIDLTKNMPPTPGGNRYNK
ncbi:MAG: hypothetical protein KAS32_01200 [Candidatus Peribacteraceae bacterium]|nr:hypothetical protein [Candidatus Peribacteraceae bacterium]